MDPDYIKSTVYEIRESDLKEKELRNKFKDFVNDYPRLFEFAVNKNIELDFLDMMLKQLVLLKENCISLDTADSNVYKTLQEKYF